MASIDEPLTPIDSLIITSIKYLDNDIMTTHSNSQEQLQQELRQQLSREEFRE